MYDPSKSTWLNPNMDYLFDTEIIEYDIRDAGFSLIKEYKLLPDEKIRELSLLPKGLERHVAVGKLQGSDKAFSDALNGKFAEIRKIFIELNGLDDNRILAVKKDAIFVIEPVKRVRFGSVQFAQKNTYSSYIRFPDIHNLEIYYSSMGTDIKGMGDSAIARHRLYMLDFLNTVISMIENKSNGVKRYMRKFVSDYKAGNLDDEFYLEFNNMSRDINPVFNFQYIIVPLLQIITREV